MKFILITLLCILTKHAISQTNVSNEKSCATLISKGYTKLFCDYDKKNAFKDITWGVKVEDLNKKINLTCMDSKQYILEELDDELKYQNWGGIIFYYSMFRFNKNKQLYNVELSVDEDTSNSIIGYTYDGIYQNMKKKFGKALTYHLKDSSEINTIGNIYGWKGRIEF